MGQPFQDQRHPPLAVVSVDSDKIRRDVQYDMPATVLNAGTGDQGTYQATAHNFLDGACLACISRADMAVPGPESSLAARLRIPQETLRPLLLGPSPLPASILAQARLTDRERAEISLIPGRDLLRRFCDELSLQDDGPAVSAPMLSAAAGILLAVDIAKQGQPGPPAVQGRVVRTNILAGLTVTGARSAARHLDVSVPIPLRVINAVQDWLRRGAAASHPKKPSAWYLAQKAMVTLTPAPQRGQIVWAPMPTTRLRRQLRSRGDSKREPALGLPSSC